LAALNNSLGRFVTEKNRLPHHMETLVNNSAATAAASGSCVGAAAGDVYCGMLDPTMFTPVTYAAGDVAVESLFKGGLTMFVNNKTDTANKTFDSAQGMFYLPGYNGGVMESGKFVTVANPASTGYASVEMHLAKALGGAGMDYDTTCYDYVAMGIGDANEMVGNTMTSSPVHFPENADLGPVQKYNHYVAIIQVDKLNTGSCSPLTEKAKFLGVVMNVPNYPTSHLFGSGQALAYTYENKVGN
jgi:hypothetical protein